jgi:Response regulator containing CheY-like receiver, AAA-type ATPase, and DNA-binding domains
MVLANPKLLLEPEAQPVRSRNRQLKAPEPNGQRICGDPPLPVAWLTPATSHRENFFMMRRKVLVVDDDPAVRHMLCRLLSEEDYLVLSASNGVEALEMVNSVDLVLLDLNLPGADGWQIFERIHNRSRAVSVIIITARHNQVFPALASGAGALMEKPLDLPKLLSIIHKLLSESEEERKARLSGRAADFHYLAADSVQPGDPHRQKN